MIIENVDALKSWLAKLLEPICDADPSALANYVVALVKKDKSEKELKALCADQLDVFLQKETVGFVDKLFECLTTKNYLGNTVAKESPKEEVKPAPAKAETREVGRFQGEAPEEERENRRRRSPLRNRSDFNEPRSRDERRREERKRRDFERHGKSGSDSHRERHDRRRGSPRGRSYSRSRSRSRSGSQGKNRDREHRGGRDFKSKFEVERKDMDGYNSSNTPGPQQQTQQQQQQQQHSSPLLPLSTPPPPHSFSSSSSVSVSAAPVATPARIPDGTKDSWSGYYSAQRQDGVNKQFGNKPPSLKQRCRDYDEKGFCVRGDHCLFDHGNDPLVVDDVNLPNMIPFPPPPVLPPAGMPMPRITEPPPPIRLPLMPPFPQPPPPGVFNMAGPPLIATSGIETPNHHSAITSSPPIGPPGVGLPPALPPPPLPPPPTLPPSSTSVSLRPQYVQSEYKYDPEGYNPESPGLTGAGRNPYRQFMPRVQAQRSNLIGLTSSEGQVSRGRATNMGSKSDPTTTTSDQGNNVARVNPEQDGRKRIVTTNAADGPAAKKPWMDKPNFNNQHKGPFPKRNHYVNTKLEVRRIPRELNNITKLNEHFSKFGTIVNIQVVFGGDPEAALIQYTMNEEARQAISSPVAVLNNRFIRVYWHRESAPNPQQQDPASANQMGGSAPVQGPPHLHKGIKQHNPAAYVLNNTVPKHRPPGAAGTPAPTKADNPNTDAVTVASAMPNTQKSFNTPLKSSSKSLGKTGKALEAQEVLKKKQEALKLQQDMRKKKQEMLKTQIECQKALINRLEKNRGMKPEERANVMKTLKELTEKITQLQNEMNPASQVSSAKPNNNDNNNQPKTKTDAQKELLDAELDFHKRMTSGEDTTDLKRKLGQLQVEATRLGIIRPPLGRGRGRGKVAQEPGVGRGRGRSRELAGRGGAVNHMVVDHRPRAIAIVGVMEEERDDLLPHFVKYGEIEELRNQDANTVIMTFKTRSEAEKAANKGAKFKGRKLEIFWYKPLMPSAAAEPDEDESKDEDIKKEGGALQPGEEEEEEEEEDDDEDDDRRSWRR
ncbi:RNA-binding protein 27 isoform X1 [Synchiropus splendidus]|uniref:RNA-binding protein 27 isoform X1 n=1 Tax=Synchiropus splendidus TaxID=270530 RepID=UPI00237EAB56|nr:RNA-binding protein 27 isoform X1 [Synchiropus splendidus]